jgi:hypothetical protein
VDFLKSIAGKVVGGVVLLGVVVAAVAFYQAGPDGRAAFFDASGKILGWTLLVAAAPWALFFLTTAAARADSNAAGAWLVGTLTTVELLVLWWMFGFGVGPAVAVGFFAAGGLLAAAYNVLACDWIADKLVG